MGQLENLMKLGLTETEAKKVLAEDAEIDRMSMTEVVNDLTEDQQKASKEARQADRKPTVYKFDTTKKTRPANESKQFLIETLRTALADIQCDEVDVTNKEREITFMYRGVKYKITLSAPRK